MMEKKKLRKLMLSKRNKLKDDEYRLLSNLIVKNIEVFLSKMKLESVGMYYPFRKEVNILPLFQKFINSKKRVYFPKIFGKDMNFCRVFSMDQFENGKYGIKEPICKEINNTLDVLLIPGVAFDKRLYRLGYGGGYFDRFLKQHPEPLKIGVAFSFQILDMIPTTPNDVKMSIVITECFLIQ